MHLVQRAVPCPVGGRRAVVSLNLLLDNGDTCVWEAAYYFGIQPHILKLTSEYLSLLHQPALLTPKYGLWENVIACSE